MMSQIEIAEKPEWVSWDDVQECQRLAHQDNQAKGIDMLCAHLTGSELASAIGDGCCLVALDSKKVVGFFSEKAVTINRWWYKGKCTYLCFGAILPEYQGQGIYSRLKGEMMKRISEDGHDFIWMNTSERNLSSLEIHLRDGFRILQYSATGEGANYYSVLMGKWLKTCPYSNFRIKAMFLLSKIVVKTLWKPGRIPRFRLT